MTTDPNKRDVALVVDDSPETLRLLTDALDSAGMTVMVAMDGAAAIRIVDQITPDIVLLDAVMPGIDGFETCRRLKRDAGLTNVPVIFMTGLAETEHIVRGLEAGGVDYVTKPIVIEEMLARIRVHLANARMTQSQDTTSRRTALPRAGFGSTGFCSAGVWSSTSPFIWHRLNFRDQLLFVFRRAGVEFRLCAVHRVNARVA